MGDSHRAAAWAIVTRGLPMSQREPEKVPREAVWIMAVYVSFMIIGLLVALLIPAFLRFDGPSNGSITRTPPPALAEATPRVP